MWSLCLRNKPQAIQNSLHQIYQALKCTDFLMAANFLEQCGVIHNCWLIDKLKYDIIWSMLSWFYKSYCTSHAFWCELVLLCPSRFNFCFPLFITTTSKSQLNVSEATCATPCHIQLTPTTTCAIILQKPTILLINRTRLWRIFKWLTCSGLIEPWSPHQTLNTHTETYAHWWWSCHSLIHNNLSIRLGNNTDPLF